MKSKSWLRKFALVCATSLASAGAFAQQAPPAAAAKAPAITLVDAGDAAQWRTWASGIGWQVIAPEISAASTMDVRLQKVQAAVEEAIRVGSVDAAHVYVAGRGGATAAVLYAISRVPDLWAAGLAIGGSPQEALDTNRIYAINFANTPVLWAGAAEGDEALAKQLQSAGMNLEFRPAATTSMGQAFEWLAQHARDPLPSAVDCETSAPAFARCYWIRMTKFDPKERNDVLPPSIIPGGTGASLDVGTFGYNKADRGPGVPVASLPEKYNGPLKVGDRIVALDGRIIANPREFAEMLSKIDQEKAAVIMVERGKDRLRVETRIVLPQREVIATARVQAKYAAEDKEIQIISRTATQMRVEVPEAWVPGHLNWNGLTLEEIKAPGCIQLSIEKELLRSEPCPK